MLSYEWFKDIWNQGLGCSGFSEVTWDILKHCYHQAHREYHIWEHPMHCIGILDEVRDRADSYPQVAFALLCHDAVYEIHRNGNGDNENVRKSAQLCMNLLDTAGAKQHIKHACFENVIATAHSNTRLEGDCALTADIDMSILGADWPTYEKYMIQIEAEYRYGGMLSELEWCLGRAAFLKRVQQKPIFHTEHFRETLREQAVNNIERELTILRNHVQELEV